MLLDQPRHAFGIRGGEPKARAKGPRHLDACARMIDPPTFGDVMQKRREIKLGAMRDLRHDLGGERQLLRQPTGFDRAKFADGANEMLIDRVMVVHRELHHADDAAEIGDESAEHAGFVHAPKRDFGGVS